MTDDIKRPDSLLLDDGNTAENWRLWKEDFEIFMRAKEYTRKPDEVRVAFLLNCIGRAARERYNHFEWETNGDENKYAAVMAKFDEHFRGRKRSVFMRYKFWTHEPSEGQDFLHYLTSLRTLADQCEFMEKDNMIRDKIVFSIKDEQLKERLLSITDLSLATTMDKCQAAETTRKEVQAMMAEAKVKEERCIEEISKRQTKPQQSKRSLRNELSPKDSIRDCQNCGFTHAPRSCPAWGQECRYCHKKNHFARVCRQKTRAKSTAVVTQDSSSNEDKELDMGTVLHINSSTNPKKASSWWQKVNVMGTMINFKLGAEANLIPLKQWKEINNSTPLKEPKAILKTIDGSTIDHIGRARVTMKANSKTTTGDVFIIQTDSVPLLGLQTTVDLDLIRRNEDTSIQNIHMFKKGLSEADIKELYPQVFDGKLGKYPGQYRICLSDEANPKFNPPRRFSHKMIKPLKRRLEEMVKTQVIEPVDHPTDWVNSIVCTEKKDGSL